MGSREWMETMRVLATLLLALAMGQANPVSAQQGSEQITGYDFKVYPAGNTTAPVATALGVFSTAVQCNQAPPASTNTVNPTVISWTDPDNAGKVCQYIPPPTGTGAILTLPTGSYQGSVTAINQAGAATESMLAPFSRLSPPAARTGVKITR